MTTLTPVQMLSNANAANLESMRVMTASIIRAVERVAALNLEAGHSAVERMTNGAGSLDADGNLASTDLQPATDEAVAYFRTVQEITAEAQGEITQALAAQANGVTDTMLSMLDKMEQAAPGVAVPAVAVATAKKVIASAQSALGSMLATGTQIAEANAAAVAKTGAAIGKQPASTKQNKKAA